MAGEDLDADDPYEVLGLSRGATVDQAAARARKLLDKYDDDHDARTAINEAFETIKEQPGPVEVNGTMVVPLFASTLSDDVEVNEEVTVRVTNHADDPVSGVELQRKDGGKRLDKTDVDGKATVQFRDQGTYTLIVKKQSHPKPDHQYKKGEVEINVKRKQDSLSFDTYPSQVEVDDEFEVRVVNSNNNPMKGVKVTTDAGSAATTESDGTTRLTADRVGTLTLEASKQPTSSKRFVDAETTVSVNERQIDLEFAQAPSQVSVDGDGTFKLINEENNPVRGVSITVGPTERTTGDDGEVVLPFGDVTPGECTVRASKGTTGGRSFTDATTKVKVTKQTKDLDIRPLDTPVIVDDPTRFKVTAGGSPVDGATVRSFDGDVDETDSDGVARLNFDTFGKTTVVASKSDTKRTVYGQGKDSVYVERETVRLQIADCESTEDGPDIEAGDDVAVEVVTVEGGSIEGARVEAEDGTSDETDGDGQARVRFNENGQKRLTASKPSDERAEYVSHTEKIDVKQRTKQLFLEGVNAPRSVSAGDPVTFRVVDELGDELSGITVYAKDENDQREETDTDGEVTFEFDVDSPQFIEIYARPDNEQFERYDSETIRVTP